MRLCLIFLTVSCLCYGLSEKQHEAENVKSIVFEFLSHVPFSKLLRTVKKLNDDVELQETIEDQIDIIYDRMEDVDDFENVIAYVGDKTTSYVNYMTNEIMNMERRNYGGVKAMLADLSKIASWDHLKRNLINMNSDNHKLAYRDLTSNEFKGLVQALLQNKAMQSIVNTINVTWQIDLISMLESLEELLEDVSMECDEYCKSSAKPVDDVDDLDDATFLEFIKFFIKYSKDIEVQNRVVDIIVYTKSGKVTNFAKELYNINEFQKVLDYLMEASAAFQERKKTEKPIKIDHGGLRATLTELRELIPWNEMKQTINMIFKIENYKILATYTNEFKDLLLNLLTHTKTKEVAAELNIQLTDLTGLIELLEKFHLDD